MSGPPEWDFSQWLEETRRLREALATLGVQVPHCLPGDAKDCGAPVEGHYASYLGLLRARVEVFWNHNLGGDLTPLALTVFCEELSNTANGKPPGTPLTR